MVYAKKIARRNEREDERALLAKAKEIATQKHPNINADKRKTLIAKIKKGLKKQELLEKVCKKI